VSGSLEDGRQYPLHDEAGQDWIQWWHPPDRPAPEGTPHGSSAVCFTGAGQVVLVAHPDGCWEFPGGRPEGDENWRATLEREVLEEACAVVEQATLLGFARGRCTRGPEAGLVLVRALWCAAVTLNPWAPQHETAERIVVPPEEALGKENRGSNGLTRKWFHEALAARGCS
jgi:ADP-ribose pyrophosphatase YjhB (NUDIX family)